MLVFCLLCALLAWLPAAATGGSTPGRYIVVLDPSVANPGGVGAQLANRFGGRLGYVYSHALKGFSVELSSDAAAALANAPGVESVTPDALQAVFLPTARFARPAGVRVRAVARSRRRCRARAAGSPV
jgi:hypothetical protein